MRESYFASKIILILVQLLLIAGTVYTVIKPGLPNNPVFWIATVTEAILGFLTYKAYVHYLAHKDYRRSYLLYLVLIIIGIGAPLAIYYTNLSYLKSAGSTWVIYLLTINSFFIYRTFRGKPLAIENVQANKLLFTIRIVHAVFLAMVPIVITILALILHNSAYVPIYSRNDQSLTLIEIVVSIFSVLCVILGLYLPWLARWHKRASRTDTEIIFIHTFRIAFIESPVFYALILGVLGGGIYVWLSLFILALAALILTFPTKRRIVVWQGKQNQSN